MNRLERWGHGVLGTTTALLLVAGVVVGCSTGPERASGSTAGSATVVAGDVPVLTGAPDPASVPAPVWQAGTRGNGNPLVNFRDTPYNLEGAPPPDVVDAPDLEDVRAVRYTMPGGGRRAELEPNIDVQQEGDDLWFGFAWYLPPDFPVNTPGWQVLAQWKNAGEGSPPVELKVGNGQFQLDGGAGGEDPQETYFTQPIGPARAGLQTNIVVHIVFSTDPTKGQVDVWMNGQQRVAAFRPEGGTRYESADSYLKTGIYRDTAISEPSVLYLNDARVATSYASASALASPGASG